jgi:hypothetical protein
MRVEDRRKDLQFDNLPGLENQQAVVGDDRRQTMSYGDTCLSL